MSKLKLCATEAVCSTSKTLGHHGALADTESPYYDFWGRAMEPWMDRHSLLPDGETVHVLIETGFARPLGGHR